MNVIDAMKQRYASKLFTGEKISDNDIEKLQEYITLAPSSFGLQPFRIKVVSDQETKEHLETASFGQKQLSTASHVFVFCADTHVEKRLHEFKELLLHHEMPKEKVEGYIGVIANFLESMDDEAIHTWASKQTYIALAHALLGAKELGYDSCPMEGFDASKYKEILGLPDNLQPTVICTVGVAADSPNPKQRFDDLFI